MSGSREVDFLFIAERAMFPTYLEHGVLLGPGIPGVTVLMVCGTGWAIQLSAMTGTTIHLYVVSEAQDRLFFGSLTLELSTQTESGPGPGISTDAIPGPSYS
jgi:hypothetical protein